VELIFTPAGRGDKNRIWPEGAITGRMEVKDRKITEKREQSRPEGSRSYSLQVIQLPNKHRHFSETFQVITAVLLRIQVAGTLRHVGG
jgi:hypothetical protein